MTCLAYILEGLNTLILRKILHKINGLYHKTPPPKPDVNIQQQEGISLQHVMDLFKAEKNNYESLKLFIKEIPFALF